MKKIGYSAISGNVRQGFTKTSLQTLGEGIEENDNSLMQAIMKTFNMNYNTGDVVILHGCVNSGSNSGAGNPYTVSAGAVYYNGEIYQVDAASGTISGTNVVIVTLTETYADGAGTRMSDNSLVNVAKVRKFVVSQAASGSGTKNFSALIDLARKYSLTSSSSQTTSSGSMVDVTGLTYTTPNDGNTRLWLILHKGYSTATAATSDGTGHEIYNSTLATQLDYTEAYQDETSNTVDQRIPYVCMWIGTLAPNTVIKARFKSLSGGSLPIKENKLLVVQL